MAYRSGSLRPRSLVSGSHGGGLAAGLPFEHDQPLFITDNALADPRIKVVPEAEEEKYQSFCAAPLRLKSGHVIGVHQEIGVGLSLIHI